MVAGMGSSDMAKDVDESFVTIEPEFKRISESRNLSDEGATRLLVAIFGQAKTDYKKCVKWLKKHKDDDSDDRLKVERRKKEVELFCSTNPWLRIQPSKLLI